MENIQEGGSGTMKDWENPKLEAAKEAAKNEAQDEGHLRELLEEINSKAVTQEDKIDIEATTKEWMTEKVEVLAD